MTKTELERAIKNFIRYPVGPELSLILKAAKDYLDTLPDDRPVPVDGELVLVKGNGTIMVSSGILNENGLHCYRSGRFVGDTIAFKDWRPLPNILQFTPHDGRSECSVDWPLVAYLTEGGAIHTAAHAQLSWEHIIAYADPAKLIIEG